ncbi:ATP binding domain 4 [Rhizopus stolonifer]|uniref:Diphthine--ammonia ligase n=1 Tax=Rhizopus stolonifer TaxID=4846 RepID=A0A367KN43_RHIST|nr:ATP binding domain 4 [Rhizopus stolonifer]
MKIVALISGGKDSCYNMMQCVANGHEIVALANLRPPNQSGKGHDAIHYYSECMDLPLYRREILGGSILQGSDYTVTANDETEDLFMLLSEVLENHPDVKGVSVGAILSNYQRVRVEHVCNRLGLTSFAYLWRRDQKELLYEMANAGVNAILIKVAAIGLKPMHLGKSIGQMYPFLCKMNDMYDLHICGEGGEYETFTIDCPLFKKRIVVDETETIIHSDDAFAQVAYLKFKKCSVIQKTSEETDMCNTVIQDWKNWDLYQDIITCVDSQDTSIIQPELKTVCLENIKREQCATTDLFPFVAISGTTAYETQNSFDSIEEETEACMKAVQEKLAQRDLSWKDVVTVNVLVRDMNDFGRINAIYKNFFDINPSPRALIGAHLKSPCNLKIDVVAIKAQDNVKRDTMHVQGISYWAPANIGPYSQSVITQGHAFIAGQIGLVPNTLELPSPKSFADEAALSLRNLETIASVLGLPLKSHVALCYCYVSSPNYLPLAEAAWNTYMNNQTPPTVYAAVPALPKGAMVEWQVVLSAPLPVSDSDDSDEEGINKLDSLNLTQEPFNTNTGSRVSIRKQMTTIVAQLTGTKDVFTDIVSSLSKSLEQSGKRWKDVLSVRVYYCNTLFLDDTIATNYLVSELAKITESVPSITSVAVDALGSHANSALACSMHIL